MSNLFSFAHVVWSKVSGISSVEKGLLSHEARSLSREESFVLRDRAMRLMPPERVVTCFKRYCTLTCTRVKNIWNSYEEIFVNIIDDRCVG